MTAARARVLVVDDHAELAETIADGLSDMGYDAVAVSSSRIAAERLAEPGWDALVTDLRMPEVDGLGLLAVSRRADPARPVIVMTAYSAVDSAIESIRKGAYHYVTKPFKVGELALFLDKALDEAKVRAEAKTLRRALRDRQGTANLLGETEPMQAVRDLVERVADAELPVLLLGETGSGKGVVARAIHAQGRRAGGPFVTVNCASLPEGLLESELFGHVKGAFTGATTARAGLFREAAEGTLFLNEIAETSPAVQAKLLHALDHGTIRPVGSDREERVAARVVAATHRDLRARVATGAFREDLFYRLDVVTIEIPPLRHRRDDVPLLARHFLARARERHPSSPVRGFAPDALAVLLAYDWPGNVRELEHVVERAVLLGRVAEVTSAELPIATASRERGPAEFRGDVVPLREIQRRYAAWAYERLGHKKVVTAERLDIDFRTLAKLLAAEPDGSTER